MPNSGICAAAGMTKPAGRWQWACPVLLRQPSVGCRIANATRNQWPLLGAKRTFAETVMSAKCLPGRDMARTPKPPARDSAQRPERVSEVSLELKWQARPAT